MKKRVSVLEWEVAQLGGRHRTMVAFAEAMARFSPWSVRLVSNWPSNWFPAALAVEYPHLGDLFQWAPMERQMEEAPDALLGLDALIIPYGGFGYLQTLLPDTAVIQWIIHPEQQRYPNVRHTWTNSETTRQRLLASPRWADSDPRVIFPPHDLSWFSESARATWRDRPIDVLCVGSLLRSKRVVEFARLARDRGWNAMVVGACWPAIAVEAGAVLSQILATGIPVKVNQTREDLSILMGASKIVASLSEIESSPLIIWEALASGAVPVMREAGAVREHLARFGYAGKSDEDVADLVDGVLKLPAAVYGYGKEPEHGERIVWALDQRDYSTVSKTVIDAVAEVLP